MIFLNTLANIVYWKIFYWYYISNVRIFTIKRQEETIESANEEHILLKWAKEKSDKTEQISYDLWQINTKSLEMAWSLNIIYYSRSEPKDHIIREIYYWKIFFVSLQLNSGQQEVTRHLWCSQPHTFSDSSPGYCSTLPAIYTTLVMCMEGRAKGTISLLLTFLIPKD